MWIENLFFSEIFCHLRRKKRENFEFKKKVNLTNFAVFGKHSHIFDITKFIINVLLIKVLVKNDQRVVERRE
jgi:hypothetical protein